MMQKPLAFPKRYGKALIFDLIVAGGPRSSVVMVRVCKFPFGNR